MTVAQIEALAETLGYTLSGSTKAEKIAAFLTAQEAAQETTQEAATTEYQLTSDTEIVEGKSYYTRSGEEGAYIYTLVETPDVADIESYYEEVE